jgi:hypothetical protein
MAGLPKKYAQMGFKKGWKAYKSSKGGASSMARKKNRKASSNKSAAKKAAPRPKGFMGRLTDINWKSQAISAGYGLARGTINRYNPLNAFFGRFGEYSDELGLYVLAQGAKAVFPKLKPYAHKMQDIEAFLMGFQFGEKNQILKNMFGIMNSTKAEGGDTVVYG